MQQQLAVERQKTAMLQRDLQAAVKDSKEAIHREMDVIAQLEAQDQVRSPTADITAVMYCVIWDTLAAGLAASLIAM